MTRSSAVLLPLVLFACHRPSGEPAANPLARNVASEVVALPEGQRRAVIFRAIRDAGLECQEITQLKKLSDAPNPQWRAMCDHRAYHLVSIDRNGEAVVVSNRETP